MKKVKQISILLALVLLFTTLGGAVYPQDNSLSAGTMEFEPRIYSNATIDENFCGRFVLVVMDRNISALNKRHGSSFFGDFPIKGITDLTARTETQVAELNEALKNERQTSDVRRSMEEFRQIIQIELPIDCKQNVLDVIRHLETVEGIVSAEPNFRGHLANAGNAPPNYNPNHQWALGRIDVQAAWGINTGHNTNVRVGIIDSGIADHVDFNTVVGNNATSIVNRNLGRQFINGVVQPVGDTTDEDGHGTRSAGIVSTGWNGAAGSVNGIGRNVTLVPLKVFDDTVFDMWVNSTIAAI